MMIGTRAGGRYPCVSAHHADGRLAEVVIVLMTTMTNDRELAVGSRTGLHGGGQQYPHGLPSRLVRRQRDVGGPSASGSVCVRYQRFQCTTSSKGRRLGLVSGRSGRPAG